jgi:hypothetical protein
MGIRCTNHATLSTCKMLTLTSPTSGSHSVGIVCLQTKATGFSFFNFSTYVHVCEQLVYSCCSHLEHRASMKCFISLQLRQFKTFSKTPWMSNQPGCLLYHTHTPTIPMGGMVSSLLWEVSLYSGPWIFTVASLQLNNTEQWVYVFEDSLTLKQMTSVHCRDWVFAQDAMRIWKDWQIV